MLSFFHTHDEITTHVTHFEHEFRNRRAAALFNKMRHDNHYQHFLWTSEWMKNEYPSPGFIFQFGKIEGALMWHRTRLGFPLGAVTIDSRMKDHVIQGRVETRAILFNLAVLLSPVLAFLATRRFAGMIGLKLDASAPSTLLQEAEQDGAGKSCGAIGTRRLGCLPRMVLIV